MMMKKLFLSLLVSLFFSSAASARDLITLVTDQTGMHRITYEQLREQGANLRGVRHQRLGLSLNGEPVAIRTTGREWRGRRSRFFGPGGYIEFYAPGSDSRYTADQAFTLSVLSRRQLASQRIDFGVQRNVFNPAESTSEQYTHTDLVEENNFYDQFSPSPNDPWVYGETLSLFPTPVYNFSLNNVVGENALAQVKVEMYGVLDFEIEGNDHHYDVEINGVTVGDRQFDGNSLDTLEVDNVAVNDGANTIKYNYISIANVPFDRISLNRFWVTYPRKSIATDGYLQGRFETRQNLIRNLGEQQANVYRKQDDGTIVRVLGTQLVGEGSEAATGFNTGGVSGEYIIVADQGYKSPKVGLIADQDDLRNGEAEYLLIAHPSLMGESLQQLVELRQQKYSVKVVDVKQIYGQFGHHVRDPQAIQNYINYAVENLRTKFVTFVGNDTYDYLGFESDSVGLIPTRYVSTPAGILTVTHAPSDASYGDLDGNGIPELAVGRLLARTESELADVVAKIQAYERREGYVGRVLVATDQDDAGQGVSFRRDAEEVIAAMPSDWANSIRDDFRAYPDIDGAQGAKDKLFKVANAGVSVISYIGHSSPISWSFTRPQLLRANEIGSFTNVDKPYVVTQWGCWNTYFVSPNGQSMADRFLVSGKTGAVAALGASTLTESTDELALGIELSKRMFEEQITIGEALVAAKLALSKTLDSPAMQLGYQIVGDPALVINP